MNRPCGRVVGDGVVGVPKLRAEEEFGDSHLHYLGLADDRVGRPERVLWAAVLTRAMTDIALWHAGRRHPSDVRGASCHSSLVSATVYRDALRWFRQRKPRQMGFLEVCEALELEPLVVLERLDRMKAEQKALRARDFSIRRTHRRLETRDKQRIA